MSYVIYVTDESSNFVMEDCFALNCNLSSLFVPCLPLISIWSYVVQSTKETGNIYGLSDRLCLLCVVKSTAAFLFYCGTLLLQHRRSRSESATIWALLYGPLKKIIIKKWYWNTVRINVASLVSRIKIAKKFSKFSELLFLLGFLFW